MLVQMCRTLQHLEQCAGGFQKAKEHNKAAAKCNEHHVRCKISQQDLYWLYVDFSSAFKTIDHDKLLCIMHDLGFPEDAIEVIAELYTDAITQALVCRNRTNQGVLLYR